MNEYNRQINGSYSEILKENQELKQHIKKLERTALEKSIEFERLRKLAGESAADLTKIYNMAVAAKV